MKSSVLIVIMGFALPFVSCSQEKVVDVLQERDGLFYAVNQDKGFTGRLESYWDAEKKQKKEEGTYTDGKANGLTTSWFENGQEKSHVNFKDGEMNGLGTLWHESGQKIFEANFKDGKANGIATSWFKNGKKKSAANFKGGKENGLMTLWNENGKKSSETNWNDGTLVETLCCE